MKSSPLRALLARRTCNCIRPRKLRYESHPLRLLSTSTRLSSSYANAPATFGASEHLRRKFQPKPGPTRRIDPAKQKALNNIKWYSYGIGICAAGILGTVWFYSGQLPQKESKQGSKPSSGNISLDAAPSIPGIINPNEAPEVEQIPTGTSTIPTFPKTIHLSSLTPPPNEAITGSGEQEYQLVGLGIRTVSFLGIQVYVVGLYIALPDIATLQERLIRTLDPVATALVAGEKDKLKALLLDPEKGEDVWNSILKDGQLRTAIRIVPTRNTDYMHLRDGFVRGITARTQHFASAKQDPSFNDESFGAALNEFKAMWGGGARKSVPKGEILLMTRDAPGKMAIWHEDKSKMSYRLGGVDDERISRMVWLGYLGGKNVSSEGTRKSVVDGVMEYVERPIGTVATQVV